MSNITLRDHFAGLAMQNYVVKCTWHREEICKEAYKWADAMIAEREELKNIMMSETTYIGETQWMQVPEPLSDDTICEILLKKEWKGFVELVRMIEKAHGIRSFDE